MLEDQRWQPVPGIIGAEIYPFFRKPDVTCSNAYVIRTSDEVLIIDTGADAGQMDRPMLLIEEALRKAPRPVTLFLTHCHIDHCYQAIRDRRFCPLPGFTAAAEEGGAPGVGWGGTHPAGGGTTGGGGGPPPGKLPPPFTPRPRAL